MAGHCVKGVAGALAALAIAAGIVASPQLAANAELARAQALQRLTEAGRLDCNAELARIQQSATMRWRSRLLKLPLLARLLRRLTSLSPTVDQAPGRSK